MKPSLHNRRNFVHRLIGLPAARVFAQETPPWQPMFDGKTLKGWRVTPFTGHGAVSVADGSITLGKGTLTGIHWTGAFPATDYEIRFDAVRVDVAPTASDRLRNLVQLLDAFYDLWPESALRRLIDALRPAGADDLWRSRAMDGLAQRIEQRRALEETALHRMNRFFALIGRE